MDVIALRMLAALLLALLVHGFLLSIARLTGEQRAFVYPTLVIIDQKGVVRHVHGGFSPTLAEDLSNFIDRLLAE